METRGRNQREDTTGTAQFQDQGDQHDVSVLARLCQEDAHNRNVDFLY